MDDQNPYAAPGSTDGPLEPPEPPRTGIWRQGPLLVVGREATLPDICPVTNLPAEIRWPTRVKVLLPARLACSLLFCPPIGLLMYGILALEGTPIVIPLRREVYTRRRFHRRISLGLVGLGALLCAFDLYEFGLPLGLARCWLLILVAAVYDGQMTTYFTADKLTADHTWIAGARADYLNRFEDFPA